jgi:hypothetical protein
MTNSRREALDTAMEGNGVHPPPAALPRSRMVSGVSFELRSTTAEGGVQQEEGEGEQVHYFGILLRVTRVPHVTG